MTNTEREATTLTSPAGSRIPTFRTIEEEAEFWDTHDSAEFEDEFETVTDVRFVVARPPTRAIRVRIDPDALATLTAQAREQGIGPSTLARRLILVGLHQSRKRKSMSSSRAGS
jgi:hypothetical protein